MSGSRLTDFYPETGRAQTKSWFLPACDDFPPATKVFGKITDPNWKTDMPVLLTNFANALFAQRVENLESDVCDIKQHLFSNERPRSLIVPVETFAPEPYDAVRPFSVVVEVIEGQCIATLYDANINASGDTSEEAVSNLKDIMLALFRRLRREQPDRLGPGPAKQLSVLSNLIRETA